jgi:phosphatidate cytidylyltransferase
MMPDNPLSNSHYLPILWKLGIVLGTIIAVLIVIYIRNRRRGEVSSMLAKALTVTWLAPLLLSALFVGRLALLIVAGVVLAQAIREYSELVSLQAPYKWTVQIYSIGGLLVSATGNSVQFLAYPFGIVAVSLAIPIVRQQVAGAVEQVAMGIFAYFYISFPITLISFIRDSIPWGLNFLLIVGTGTALADAGGFIVGTRLKGPRLAPVVSPMKTWSGAFGSLLGAFIGVALSWSVAPRTWHPPTAVLIACCVAVSATLGDLSESVLKRSFYRKDAGTVMAGFGGILDRFDSYLFTIPATLALLTQALHVRG